MERLNSLMPYASVDIIDVYMKLLRDTTKFVTDVSGLLTSRHKD